MRKTLLYSSFPHTEKSQIYGFFFSNKVETNENDEKKPILDPDVSNAEQYKEQKRESQIKKLEKAQKKCARLIKKLEEKEMSLDDLDDEDSTYLKVSNFQNAGAAVEPF